MTGATPPKINAGLKISLLSLLLIISGTFIFASDQVLSMLSPLTPTATPTAWPTSTATFTPTASPPPAPSPTPPPTPALPPSPTATLPPQPTPDGVVREVKVPILMYHHIAEPPLDAGPVRRDLSVPPDAFEAQLRYLVGAGYQPIHLRDLLMHLQIGTPLPPKPVILTFDDGYKDNYTNAYPLLKKYGFVATFFIITALADQGGEEYMSWEEIEVLSADGMEIEAHSHTHRDLRDKSTDFIVFEVLRPKEAIEARTNHVVRFFSYPMGKHNQRVEKVLRSAHYWGAVTVNQGASQSSPRTFELPRIRVRGSYSVTEFAHWINSWLR